MLNDRACSDGSPAEVQGKAMRGSCGVTFEPSEAEAWGWGTTGGIGLVGWRTEERSSIAEGCIPLQCCGLGQLAWRRGWSSMPPIYDRSLRWMSVDER